MSAADGPTSGGASGASSGTAPAPPATAGGSGPAVELDGVWFSFGRVPVLEDVDLDVPRGAFLGIIGPNGAGKTTLLKLVLGLLDPDRGRIRVLGDTPEGARGRVGYVPQFARFDLDFPIRVRDVVLMGRLGDARPMAGYRQEAVTAAERALRWVELEEMGDRHVGELSGGQLQRTLIARALAMEPEVLLLDEPTSSVDTRVGGGLYDMLHHLTDRMTIILVSHDVGVIAREVDSVACLNRRLYHHGSEELTQEVLEAAYGGDVEMLSHEGEHRVLRGHGEGP